MCHANSIRGAYILKKLSLGVIAIQCKFFGMANGVFYKIHIINILYPMGDDKKR